MHLFGTVDDNTFFYDLMKVRELEKFEETKIYLQFGVEGLEKYTFTFYKRTLGVLHGMHYHKHKKGHGDNACV